jgi:hypothetical protein
MPYLFAPGNDIRITFILVPLQQSHSAAGMQVGQSRAIYILYSTTTTGRLDMQWVCHPLQRTLYVAVMT